MKRKDVLLERWAAILGLKPDAPAIFNTGGEIVRTFRQIEERARRDETKFPVVKPHNVHAIQIGNHFDWPSVFIVGSRTQRVILPFDESLIKDQADAAFKIAAMNR